MPHFRVQSALFRSAPLLFCLGLALPDQALGQARQTPPPRWTLAAGGDIMLYAMSPARDPFKAIAPVFQKADVAFANLEIPLTNARQPTPRKSAEDLKARRQFVLKADPKHGPSLQKLGLDLVSLANNHTMDFGVAGMRQTRGLLDQLGIRHSGSGENLQEAERVAVFRLRSGLRVGLLSYLGFIGDRAHWVCGPATETRPGIASLMFQGNLGTAARTRLKSAVARARTEADVVLVALHWGLEKQTRPTPYQIALGRAWIDAGADAVLGSHPHVLQGKEVYKGKPILYSMGNLISPLPAHSAVYQLSFEGRTFKSWTFRPMRNRNGRAEWYSAAEESRRRAGISALDRLIPKPRPASR